MQAIKLVNGKPVLTYRTDPNTYKLLSSKRAALKFIAEARDRIKDDYYR